MGEVIYSMGVSIDGYVEDTRGDYAFAAPRDDIHAVANQQQRDAAASVMGRRMFAEMDVWRTMATEDGHPAVVAEFAAAYVATPRYVVSDTLTEAPEATVVPRSGARELVERLRDSEPGPVDISGPTLAAPLVDLVDEFRIWMNPVAVGAGKPFFPALAEPLRLRLEECRTYAGGTLYLRYRRE